MSDIDITHEEQLCLQALADNWWLTARQVGECLDGGSRSGYWVSWRLRQLFIKGLVHRRKHYRLMMYDVIYEYQLTNDGRAKLQELIDQSDKPLILGIQSTSYLTQPMI